MNKEKSPIISSAKDFIVESLENYSKKKLDFAIVNAITACELILKERLARINYCLIFENIDSKKLKNERTVSLRNLPQRLINLGISIEPREVNLIKMFADWRNQIVHHMPSFDRKKVTHQLPHLLDFISIFLRKELDFPVEKILPKRLYKTVNGLLEEWERVKSEARDKARREGEGKILNNACPNCGVSNVLTLLDDRRVYCHLCDTKHYHYDYCTECGKKTVSTFSKFDEGNICDECINAAGDQYIQMLIDKERGK